MPADTPPAMPADTSPAMPADTSPAMPADTSPAMPADTAATIAEGAAVSGEVADPARDLRLPRWKRLVRALFARLRQLTGRSDGAEARTNSGAAATSLDWSALGRRAPVTPQGDA